MYTVFTSGDTRAHLACARHVCVLARSFTFPPRRPPAGRGGRGRGVTSGVVRSGRVPLHGSQRAKGCCLRVGYGSNRLPPSARSDGAQHVNVNQERRAVRGRPPTGTLDPDATYRYSTLPSACLRCAFEQSDGGPLYRTLARVAVGQRRRATRERGDYPHSKCSKIRQQACTALSAVRR